MDTIPTELLQLGAVAAIFILFIREFFRYLNGKKNGNGNGTSKNILKELQIMNTNHLNEICEKIDEGNTMLITTIHNDNIKIIELLGEIKGKIR